MTIAPPRRIALALATLLLAGALFHAQVAAALVTRGDELLAAGDLGAAVRAYRRAQLLDATSSVAPDRLAFALLMRHRPDDDARAYAAADAALHRFPDDANLRVDRGFAAQRLGRRAIAARDFARAAALAHDRRYARLARRLARSQVPS